MRKVSILGAGWLMQKFIQKYLNVYNLLYTYRKPYETTEQESNALLVHLDGERIYGSMDKLLETETLILSVPPPSSRNPYKPSVLLPYLEKSKVKKILLLSSTSVYLKSNGSVDEKSPLNPHSSMYELEQAILSINNVALTILRFGGLIGAERHPGNFFRRTLQLSNGNALVNLIHYEDCLSIIHQIIQNDIWGTCFNCCADHHPVKKDFYTAAAASLGYELKVDATLSPNSYVLVDNSKLKRVLNYEFLHNDLMALIEPENWC